jgi:tRNA dimethylallyltransferase
MNAERRTPQRHGIAAAREGSRALRAPKKRHALPRVVFVVGPTSSGKTALGLRLARLLGGEIVNADARQVYRDLTIGTGKPAGKRQGNVYIVEGIPHHLMDVLPPDRSYSVAEWRDAALKAIKSIVRRKKTAIVVGGTGLYVSSLIDNYQFPRVEAQPFLRASLDSKSLEELVQVLLAADPDSANIVDLKNKRRVIRALEVVTFSGKKFSEARGKAEPLVEGFLVGVRHTPEDLYARMEQTIDGMFDAGLLDEVRKLLRKGIPPDAPSMTSIGYSDIARHLRGDLTLDEVKALIKRRTRQYTKRQITWFKRDARIHWAKNEDDAVKIAKRWVKKKPKT